jgi:hypothetical protein
MSALRLTLSAQGQNLSEPVTPQGIDQRYPERAVAFFAAASARVLRESLAQPPPAPMAEALRTRAEAVVEGPEVRLGAGGAEGVPVRVVAFRLSQESAGRRRAALREAQRRQGRTPTAEALELAGGLILTPTLRSRSCRAWR